MPAARGSTRTPATAPRAAAARTKALPTIAEMDAYVARTIEEERDQALQEAQQLIYDAWEGATARATQVLARKAIAVSPLCADGYGMLATYAKSTEAACDLFTLAVAAGERALGPVRFRELAGEFWGFLETRPYMSARFGLACCLLELGQQEAAIGHFNDLLDLNPEDNQGVRYTLLACLLERDDIAGARDLLASYEDEASVYWSYTRLLLMFRDGATTAETTQELLREAWEVNRHVPAILAGTKAERGPKSMGVAVGSAEEATAYVQSFGAAWHATPGAVAWLADACVGPRTSRSRAKAKG